MQRIALLVAMALVYGGALLSAAITSREHDVYRRNEAPRQVAQATPQSQPATEPQTSPTTRDSTYEQYIREREETAATQAAETATPTAASISPMSLQFNLDFTNAYFYRGIVQQTEGLIVQPAARLTVRLHERDDFAIDAILATWNSFGDNAGTNTSEFISDWYEADVIAGIALTKGKFSLTTTYAILTSPADAFQTVQELDLTLAFDDTEHLGKFALHPYALLAFETGGNGSDGPDLNTGTYLELGVAPGFSLDVGETPIAISFPLTVGLSLDDYYQNADGDDETFGYAQIGAKAAIPMPFGDRFGRWTLNAGVSGLFLGDNMADLNGGDDFEVIGVIGLQWNF